MPSAQQSSSLWPLSVILWRTWNLQWKNCSDVSLQAEDRRSPACDEGRRGVALAVAGCFFLQKQTLLTEFFRALSEGFLCVEFHLQCECFVCLHTALHRKYPSVAGDERNGRRETWFCLRKKSLLLPEVPCWFLKNIPSCQGHDSEPRGHDNVPVAGLAVACCFKITRRVNLCHSKLQGLQAGPRAVCSCR